MPVAAPLAAVGSFIGAHATAAAIVGSTLVGSKLSSDAAKKAAGQQVGAANNATQLQADMFNQIRNDLEPYRNIGTSAAPSYLALLGLGGSAAQPDWNAYLRNNPDVAAEATKEGVDPVTFAQQHYNQFGKAEGRALPMTSPVSATAAMQHTLENIPGYKFARDQGIKSVNNALGGRGLSGAQAKGISKFVTGLADQTYNDQVTRLLNATTMGQNAANQTGGFGSAAATNSGNALIGAGNAAAAGTVGSANALSNGIYNFGQSYLTSKLLGSGVGAPSLAAGVNSPPSVNVNSGGFYGDGGYYG